MFKSFMNVVMKKYERSKMDFLFGKAFVKSIGKLFIVGTKSCISEKDSNLQKGAFDRVYY